MSDLKERPNYIDLAKVIGMFCVVLGHFIYYFHIDFVPNSDMTKVSHFVTLFHMPFFFVVSGLVSSFRIENRKSFIYKQFKVLLLPYFLWGGILGLSYAMLEFVKIQNPMIFIRFFIALFSGSDFPGCALGWAGQLWFVYALFFIKLVVGIGLTIKKRFLRFALFGAFFAGGGLMLYCQTNPLPFRIDCIFVGFIFVMIGLRLKKIFLLLCESKRNSLITFVISVFLLLLFEVFYIDNSIRQGLSINANYFGIYPVLFVVSGVAGSLMLLSISRITFVKKDWLGTMSNGLICYLALHRVLFEALHGLYSVESIYGMFATSILVFALLYPITLLINKFFPILLGFRK